MQIDPDPACAKLHALDPEPKTLFPTRLARQGDPAPCRDHAMPGESVCGL